MNTEYSQLNVCWGGTRWCLYEYIINAEQWKTGIIYETNISVSTELIFGILLFVFNIQNTSAPYYFSLSILNVNLKTKL